MKTTSARQLAAAALCALAFTPSISHAAADDPVTLRVTPERDFLYRRGPREVIVEVEVKARPSENTRHSAVNVAVVLDHSGSMEGAKLEKARQAACVALDRLEPEDVFSLVIYDNEAELLIAPERVGSRDHRDALKERIDHIRPGGGTALYAGVQLGAKQVRRLFDKERVNRVILLSDGLANVGPSKTSDLTRVGRELRGEGISVTTIGLGDDFNEDLMTALAESSRANYYYVKDAEKLPEILTKEFQSAGTMVAGNIRIRIEAPEGVRLREIIGHPEITCGGRNAEIVMPELFGDEHRLFHLRCAIDDTPAGDSAPLARVALSYDDSANKRSLSQDTSAEIRITDDERKSEESVRNGVAQNVSVLQNRIDKESAVKLADAGRAKEAAELLRRRATSNSALPAPQQMPGVSGENKKLETWAAELSATGALPNVSRKAAQYDNYQDKYQKK